jgi:thiamine-phosphate pyrophosphorylase
MATSSLDEGTNSVPATLSEVAQKLNLAARKKWQIAATDLLPPLLLLSDDIRLPDPATAMQALPAGSGFIFRHYNDPDREETAARLRPLAGSANIVFIVAADLDLALRVKADGCHMPEHKLKELVLCGTKFAFNTGAAHSREGLEAAKRHGANAALLSPIFATKSHPGGEVLGPKLAKTLAKAAALPVYALGGISTQTAADLTGGSFAGIAGIAGIAEGEGLAATAP